MICIYLSICRITIGGGNPSLYLVAQPFMC